LLTLPAEHRDFLASIRWGRCVAVDSADLDRWIARHRSREVAA
jgi:hypothetical protein